MTRKTGNSKNQSGAISPEADKVPPIWRKKGESMNEATSRVIIEQPEVLTAVAVKEVYGFYGIKDDKGERIEFSLFALNQTIRKQAEAVEQGDLSGLEKILVSQVYLLDASFKQNASRAARSEYVNQSKIYTELALKTQNLARRTILAIADLKNPNRTTFIKQQNNAVNQQVNNAAPGKNYPENELLEDTDERVDRGEKKTAIGTDTAMETLGEINRPKVRRGKAKVVAK